MLTIEKKSKNIKLGGDHLQIHTLGPAATDSCQAAQYYIKHYLKKQTQQSVRVVLHPSFEKLFEQFSLLANDLLVIPAAFCSRKLNLTWGEWHYRNLSKLELQDSFIYPLAPMVLLENMASTSQIAYTHAALSDLILQFIQPQKLRCSASKYAAYQEYLVDGQYVLTNEKNVKLRSTEKVLQRFTPQMVWTVYQIKEFSK